jgi:hypothetical protein
MFQTDKAFLIGFAMRKALSVLAAFISYIVTRCITKTCVHNGRGQVTRRLEKSQAADADRKRLAKNNLSRCSQNGADSILVPIRGHRQRTPGQYPTTTDS